MFKLFSGGDDDQSWPLAKVSAALELKYADVELAGEDGPITVYAVHDNGVNFIVAMMQSAPGSGKIIELGFLACFIGFPVDAQKIESINRNLHISVATLEGADLYLMAGLLVSGAYDDGQFSLILDAWRRDLMMALNGLNDETFSMAAAFPAAKSALALKFATNKAPERQNDQPPIDILSSFLGANASKVVCDDCGGRGKRGLIARMCGECDGTGFVNARGGK